MDIRDINKDKDKNESVPQPQKQKRVPKPKEPKKEPKRGAGRQQFIDSCTVCNGCPKERRDFTIHGFKGVLCSHIRPEGGECLITITYERSVN
jgi:hypothetical protein